MDRLQSSHLTFRLYLLQELFAYFWLVSRRTWLIFALALTGPAWSVNPIHRMSQFETERPFEQAKSAFECMTVDQLLPLVKLLEAGSKIQRKGELVSFLTQRLQSMSELRSIWDRLDEIQQAAVSEAVHNWKGLFLAERFEAKYGRCLSVWGSRSHYGPYGFERRKSEEVAKPWLQLLFIRGAIPTDLQNKLRSFVPPPAEVGLTTLAAAPEVFHDEAVEIRETERVALHELLAVLRLVDAGKIAVGDKTRVPSTASLKWLSAELMGGDFYADADIGPMRSCSWPLLLQVGGLARFSQSKLRLSPAGREALSRPVHETLRRVWSAWIQSDDFDELRRIDIIRGQGKGGSGRRGLTPPHTRRLVLAHALAKCPAGVWISVDEFFRFMRASGLDFEVTHNAWDLYICEKQYGSLGYEGFGDWHILQARYALAFLVEYVATLGMIDVALASPAGAREDFSDLWGVDDLEFFSRYDGLLAFRLNNLGAHILGLASFESYVPPKHDAKPVLKLTPELEIVARQALAASDRIFLELYAEAVSEDCWKIRRPKLLVALEKGHRIPDFREFLLAKSGAEIPESIDQLLRDAEERTGWIKDAGQARLLECEDEDLARLIAGDASIKKLYVFAYGTKIVVPVAAESKFRHELVRLGYVLPAAVKSG